MLLLLRGAISAAPAATLGITFGLSGVSGPTASVGIALGLTPPNEFELNVVATSDIHFGLTGISSGFLSRSAVLDTRMDISATPSFTDVVSVPLVFGLSGTVGSFLQNSATLGINFDISGQIGALPVATLTTVLGISGAPTISGGTVSTASTLGINFGLSLTAPVLLSTGTVDLKFSVQAVPTQYGQAANLPRVPYISGVGAWDITVRTYG